MRLTKKAFLAILVRVRKASRWVWFALGLSVLLAAMLLVLFLVRDKTTSNSIGDVEWTNTAEVYLGRMD